MKRALRIISLLLVGFGIGFFTRARLQHGRFGRPSVDMIVGVLERRLDLDASQTTAVRAALERAEPRFAAIRAEFRPRFAEVQSSVRSEIETVLTEPQRAKYTELMAEFERRKTERFGKKP